VLIGLLKEKIYNEWTREYQIIGQQKGQQYMLIEPIPRQQPWFKNYNAST
jgi:hypothetical protein